MPTKTIDAWIQEPHTIITRQLPQNWLSKLLRVWKWKVQAIIVDASWNTITLDASRGLLRSWDDFLRVGWYGRLDAFQDIEVVLDPSKLQCVYQWENVVIMKDDKFVYYIPYMDLAAGNPRLHRFISVISSSPDEFREIGSNKHWIFHTDGAYTFCNGRPQSPGEVKNIEWYSRDENYLYRGGIVVFTKDSWLDILTVQQLSEHYFTDKSWKVIYLDPYPRGNNSQKRFYVLEEWVDIQNFRWVPEADGYGYLKPTHFSVIHSQ